MFDIFSTRELVSILYLLLIVVLTIIKSKNIKPFTDLIKTTLNKIFIIPVLCLLGYAALIVYGLQYLPFWEWLLIKDIIIWVLFVATPVCFKAAVNRKTSDYPFKKMILDNFVWSAILEFFIGSFTFSFFAELIVVPAFSFLILLQNYDRKNEELKDVHKFLDVLSAIAGLLLLIFTIDKATDVIAQKGIVDVLVSFCIPIIFSIAFLPLVYIMAIRGKYHDLFVRIKIRHKGDECELKQKKISVICACGVSYKKLRRFEQEYYSTYIRTICSGNDDETFLTFVDKFKKGGLHNE